MLLASNGPVATFVLFSIFSFAEISQGSENQPSDGVGDPLNLFSERKFVEKRAVWPTSFSPTTDDGLPPSVDGGSTTLSPVTAGQGAPIDQVNVEPGTRKGGPGNVGRTNAQPGSWPWQVLLKFKAQSSKPVYCGGSILKRSWVVTAAHCFDCGNNPEFFTLTAGEHDVGIVEGTEQIIPVDKIIVHPNYDPTVSPSKDYDVALLKLRNPINFTSNIRPVLLPTKDFSAGTNCYATGWGKTTEGGKSQILQQAQVPLISRATCRESYGIKRITERMRCGGFFRGGVDSCEGDSGGPLVCQRNDKWYLVGVISWGVGCARPNKFGVYSDMLALGGWVQDTITSTPPP